MRKIIYLLILLPIFSCWTKNERNQYKHVNTDLNTITDTKEGVHKNKAKSKNIESFEKEKLEFEKRWSNSHRNYEFYIMKLEGNSKNENRFISKIIAIYSIDNEIINTVSDSINSDCPTENYIGYLNNSFEITDLDRDNVIEITFIYKYYCKGDISPSSMRLIMFEDKDVYFLNGKMKNKFTTFETIQEFKDGKILENGFKNSPEEFHKWAKKKWDEYNYDNEFD